MPDAAADSLMCRSCTSPDSGPEYQNLGINGLEDDDKALARKVSGRNSRNPGSRRIFKGEV